MHRFACSPGEKGDPERSGYIAMASYSSYSLELAIVYCKAAAAVPLGLWNGPEVICSIGSKRKSIVISFHRRDWPRGRFVRIFPRV